MSVSGLRVGSPAAVTNFWIDGQEVLTARETSALPPEGILLDLRGSCHGGGS